MELTPLHMPDGTQVHFYFSPLQDMFSALHLLAAPQHHLAVRAGWVMRAERALPQSLLQDIRSPQNVHEIWLVPLDMAAQTSLRDMDIKEGLARMARWDLARWDVYAAPYGIEATSALKEHILRTARAFYTALFAAELHHLAPLMQRLLPGEAARCERVGLDEYLPGIHERIEVRADEFLFYKKHLLHFKRSEVKHIYITASTFVAPHLLLMYDEGRIFLTRLVMPEGRAGEAAPADLLACLQALADPVRLHILRILDAGPSSTSALAGRLGMSKAGVSKHLQVLVAGGVLQKKRSGHSVLYSICVDTLDYIPYRLFEYLRF